MKVNDVIQARAHMTGKLSLTSLCRLIDKALEQDPRFDTESHGYPEGSPQDKACEPHCLDVLMPDDGGSKMEAVIRTDDGRTVRCGFEFDGERVTMDSGETPEATGAMVWARDAAQTAITAADIIRCRSNLGQPLAAEASEWKQGQPVEFIFAPGGVHNITAGFRKNDTITVAVYVDEQTARDLQASYDTVKAGKQEPYCDEDHEGKKATLRFPANVTTFKYGVLRGETGVIVAGEPTSYGAEVVNGKVYRSFSPEFFTDADYSKATVSEQSGGVKHYTFPDGVRGSESNPARMIGVNFVLGALTNSPAFRAMPPVKAKLAVVDGNAIAAAGTSEGVRKSWETRKGLSPNEIAGTNDRLHHAIAKYRIDPSVESKTEIRDAILHRHKTRHAQLTDQERYILDHEYLKNNAPDLLHMISEPTKSHQPNMNTDTISATAVLRTLTAQLEAGAINLIQAGDYPGHPFRGNQWADGEGEGARHKASRRAHMLSKEAKTTRDHRSAARAHEEAANLHEDEDNDQTVDYHRAAAAYHRAAAGAEKRQRADLESKYGVNSPARASLHVIGNVADDNTVLARLAARAGK